MLLERQLAPLGIHTTQQSSWIKFLQYNFYDCHKLMIGLLLGSCDPRGMNY